MKALNGIAWRETQSGCTPHSLSSLWERVSLFDESSTQR